MNLLICVESDSLYLEVRSLPCILKPLQILVAQVATERRMRRRLKAASQAFVVSNQLRPGLVLKEFKNKNTEH